MNRTGLKIVTRNRTTFNDRAPTPYSTTTAYRLPDRLRWEHHGQFGYSANPNDPNEPTRYVDGPLVAHITLRDLRKSFTLNLDDGEYTSGRLPRLRTWRHALARLRSRLRPPAPLPPATLVIETTTVDTGERRQMFGRQARHTITTRRETSLEGSDSDPNPKETVTDGWYIDIDRTFLWDRFVASHGKRVHTYLTVATVNRDKRGRRHTVPSPMATFKDVGEPETGFPVATTSTYRSTSVLPDGTRKTFVSVDESEVIELAEGPLDPALFEVPRGYRRVRQIRQDPRRPMTPQGGASAPP